MSRDPAQSDRDSRPVRVRIELGRRMLELSALSRVDVGSVIDLDCDCDADVDLYADGRLFAHGQAVLLGDKFAVRMKRIIPEAAVRPQSVSTE